MTIISLPVNKTPNTAATSLPGYGAVPPQLSGQVYTTGTTTVSNGAYLSSTGTNNVWTTGTSSIPNETIRINQTNPPTVDIKGNLTINGRDLEERLNTIEKVLLIPERDVKLEKKHPKLKKLYDEYITALGKYRTFEAIKGDDDVA
jgi:hypothetical protein